jgi:hypothetical protein
VHVPHGTIFAIGTDIQPDGKLIAVPTTDGGRVKDQAASGVPYIQRSTELNPAYYRITAVDDFDALTPGSAGGGDGPTYDELVAAAFEGAQRAERE